MGRLALFLVGFCLFLIGLFYFGYIKESAPPNHQFSIFAADDPYYRSKWLELTIAFSTSIIGALLVLGACLPSIHVKTTYSPRNEDEDGENEHEFAYGGEIGHMGKPTRCPRCGSGMIGYDMDSGKVYCSACGKYTFVGKYRY